ncbi:unnamed protein product [Caenorhabditis sp. 36 PRJEB53466]|nr:unnamed protein product [Caenorhabditis sp. 36 PRJEB53466]
MRKGKFLIVNEPNGEAAEQKLRIPAEVCDIFPAQVYIPRLEKGLKGVYCVMLSLVLLTILILMTTFFSNGYLIPIVIEGFFLIMYVKEHVSVLFYHLIYLMINLCGALVCCVIGVLPDNSGTRQDMNNVLPTTDRRILCVSALAFGLFTCFRLVLMIEYSICLYYSNLRDKFKKGKVILQPL